MDQRRTGTGLTGFASLPPAPRAESSAGDLECLGGIRDVLAGLPLALLTGAGLSTDSGIPDYRGPDSPPRAPMTYQEFVSGPRAQQRYWARSHLGWQRMGTARPNPGHRAVATLQHGGAVGTVITQNVDGLH